MKKCPKCKRALDESSFQKCCKNKDGLQYYCRECTNKMSKDKYYRNHEYELERQRIKREKNPDYLKEYHKKNRDRILKQKHEYYIKHKTEYMERKRNYRKTKQGAEIERKSNLKYKKSKKGKESAIRSQAKRKRNLKWIKLWENPFPDDIDIHYHHINKIFVVPMPASFHDKLISRPIDEHYERANLWLFYLYGFNMDVFLHANI